MALTLSYQWPVTGATAPAATTAPPELPTSSVRYNEVATQVIGDAVSTSIQITTNLQLTAAELAAGFPEVVFEPSQSGAPSWWVSAKASNSVTLGFSGTFTSGVTFGVARIKRPDRPTL
jgi:hypothetical protein